MKEIRTIKMVEQTEIKFVANDGKEFDNEYECRQYERKLDFDKLKKDYERLNIEYISLPIATDCFCDGQIFKIIFESKKDYYTFVDYNEINNSMWDNEMELPNEFPCTKLLVSGYDWCFEYKHDLKQELVNALQQLEK